MTLAQAFHDVGLAFAGVAALYVFLKFIFGDND